jgi:transcriptional regulator with XRE-family HTH domain
MPRRSRTNRSSSSATLPKDLGARLRKSREEKGITGRGLAQYLGISPSLISQIERGRVVPSVGTLYAITTHLEMGIDDLFRDANGHRPEGAVRAGRVKKDAISPIQDSRTRQMIRLAEGIRWERLTPQPDSETEFYYVVYEVGAESCPKDSLIRHGGKEYGYLIQGRLGLKIGFEEFELRPGDSISFDPQIPHRQWTIGKKRAEAIWVVCNRHSDNRAPRP